LNGSEEAQHVHAANTGTILSAIVLQLSVAAVALGSSDLRLVDAVKRQDTEAARTLLTERVDVNTRAADGATALQWAAHWDDAETVGWLIGAGARVNAANDYGVTALSLACENGNPGMVAALLKAGADPNAARSTGETPLMTAARTGVLAVVEALAASGADVKAKELGQAQDALMWAISEKHAPVARALIARGADVHGRSKGGYTPLLFAARVGDSESARALMAAGANVNDVAPDGSSPLLMATVRGHTALALHLLASGADPNAAGAGFTALHWASGGWETELTGPKGIVALPERDEEWAALQRLESRRMELVTALLAHGADPNALVTRAPARFGFSVFRATALTDATPLFVAAMSGQADVMRVLAAAGADPSRGNRDKTTPLMAAAGVGRVLAESLVTVGSAARAAMLAFELGGDVNAVNATGDTALHGAAHIRADALVQFLVERGADMNVRNKRGETPLTIAEHTISAGSIPAYGRSSTGDLLRRLGATDVPRPEITR
jgi:ankyrin repeat protein